jgi:hypothetical protein
LFAISLYSTITDLVSARKGIWLTLETVNTRIYYLGSRSRLSLQPSDELEDKRRVDAARDIVSVNVGAIAR